MPMRIVASIGTFTAIFLCGCFLVGGEDVSLPLQLGILGLGAVGAVITFFVTKEKQ